MAWFYCSSVLYVILEHFYMNLIESFLENQCFLINTGFGQVRVIANDMLFLKN